MKDWIKAFRLRTLPLTFSCIIVGTALASKNGFYDSTLFILALSTTLFLQILSNLANDYGDTQKGTDNENRIGPIRGVQSGTISISQIKTAIIVFVILALVSGLSLVFYATREINFWYTTGFIVLGVLAIISAIKYTSGKGAYGYKGMGDIFVFIFFGIVGVSGTYFLFTNSFDKTILLPSISIGLFSAAVLNLNNMRDCENDKASGKNTLVVKVGLSSAKRYHLLIIIVGMLSSFFFIFNENFKLINFIFLVSFIPFILHLLRVRKVTEPKHFDPELKKVALTTFLFAVLFWVSVVQ
jgi:1,4-dihydroxy-2-naphthoate octaprenyltransferase